MRGFLNLKVKAVSHYKDKDKVFDDAAMDLTFKTAYRVSMEQAIGTTMGARPNCR